MNNFLSVSEKFANTETAKVQILSFPYEKTVTYMSGCSLGPKAIIQASAHVELYDEEYNVKPHTLGIATLPSPTFVDDHSKNLEIIEKEFLKSFNDGKFSISLG